MRALLILIGLLFTICQSSYGLEGKTLVFFINGDWHYKGPIYEEDGIRLKDQANLIYRRMVDIAKNDKKNNYVLFYDPLGKGKLFNRKWVKLRVYKKGDRTFGLGLKHSEINANSPVFHEKLRGIIKRELGAIKKENSLFYYYGEHFPASGEVTLDLGGEATKKERGLGLQKILKLMDLIGPFHTAIFHTCYMNALDFIGPLTQRVNQVIVPRKAIINTHQDWSALRMDSFSSFSDSFIKLNSNEKYQWQVYKKEVLKLKEAITILNEQIDSSYWNKWLRNQKDEEFQGLRQRGDNTLFLIPLAPSAPKEVFVPLYDYINLINQYLKSGEELLDKVDHILDNYPHLDKLYKQVNTPLL